MTTHSQAVFNSIIQCANITNCQCTISNPCKNIICYQNQFPVVHWHSCEPWNGKIDKAPILFLLSNPSYSQNELFPFLKNNVPACKSNVSSQGWTIKDVQDFFEYRFDWNRNIHSGSNMHYVESLKVLEEYIDVNNQIQYRRSKKKVSTWENLCKYSFALKHNTTFPLQSILKSSLKVNNYSSIINIDNSYEVSGKNTSYKVCPGDDFAISEVVKCKSTRETGVKSASPACRTKYLQRVISCFTGNTICLVGKHAQNSFKQVYGIIRVTRCGSYIFNKKTYCIYSGNIVINNIPRTVYFMPHPSRANNVVINGIRVK